MYGVIGVGIGIHNSLWEKIEAVFIVVVSHFEKKISWQYIMY